MQIVSVAPPATPTHVPAVLQVSTSTTTAIAQSVPVNALPAKTKQHASPAPTVTILPAPFLVPLENVLPAEAPARHARETPFCVPPVGLGSLLRVPNVLTKTVWSTQ